RNREIAGLHVTHEVQDVELHVVRVLTLGTHEVDDRLAADLTGPDVPGAGHVLHGDVPEAAELPCRLLPDRLTIPDHQVTAEAAAVRGRAEPDVIRGVVLAVVAVRVPAPTRAQRLHRVERGGQTA